MRWHITSKLHSYNIYSTQRPILKKHQYLALRYANIINNTIKYAPWLEFSLNIVNYFLVYGVML